MASARTTVAGLLPVVTLLAGRRALFALCSCRFCDRCCVVSGIPHCCCCTDPDIVGPGPASSPCLLLVISCWRLVARLSSNKDNWSLSLACNMSQTRIQLMSRHPPCPPGQRTHGVGACNVAHILCSQHICHKHWTTMSLIAGACRMSSIKE